MRKVPTVEEILEPIGPMNSVSADDARVLTKLDNKDTLTPIEERAIRLKKRKLVKSTKKHDRYVAKKIMDVIEDLDK